MFESDFATLEESIAQDLNTLESDMARIPDRVSLCRRALTVYESLYVQRQHEYDELARTLTMYQELDEE